MTRLDLPRTRSDTELLHAVRAALPAARPLPAGQHYRLQVAPVLGWVTAQAVTATGDPHGPLLWVRRDGLTLPAAARATARVTALLSGDASRLPDADLAALLARAEPSPAITVSLPARGIPAAGAPSALTAVR